MTTTSKKKTAGKKDDRFLVLKAALPDIAFDGWTEEILARAAKKAAVKAAEVFPDGILGLALYFSEWADDAMLAKLTPQKLAGLKIREKIALGVRTRLEILSPYKGAVQSLVKFMAVPHRALHVPKQVWSTADKVWWAAGDTATDYNHYTKRILLSGVISSTALYWLNDMSDGHEATWRFLDKRIDNVLVLGKALSSFRRKA